MDVPERRRWELHQRGFQYSVSQGQWSAGEHTLIDHEIDRIPEEVWYQFMDQLPRRVRRLRAMAKDTPNVDDAGAIAAMYGVSEAEVRRAEFEAVLHPLVPLVPVLKDTLQESGDINTIA